MKESKHMLQTKIFLFKNWPQTFYNNILIIKTNLQMLSYVQILLCRDIKSITMNRSTNPIYKTYSRIIHFNSKMYLMKTLLMALENTHCVVIVLTKLLWNQLQWDKQCVIIQCVWVCFILIYLHISKMYRGSGIFMKLWKPSSDVAWAYTVSLHLKVATENWMIT